MGGSPPSAPTVVMPAPTAPTTYQSVVPLESYQQAADYVKRLTEKTREIEKQTYREVGTPAEIGARQAGRRALETSAYAASIPTSDKYLSEATGRTDQFKSFKEDAESLASQAEKEYNEALSFADEMPTPEKWETPSWAKSTIPEGMPGYKSPAEREAEKSAANQKRKAAVAAATAARKKQPVITTAQRKANFLGLRRG